MGNIFCAGNPDAQSNAFYFDKMKKELSIYADTPMGFNYDGKHYYS